MRSGQIPNNPYIIAKNVPHPGAFFVFGGGVAAIVVQQLKFMLQKNKPLLSGEAIMKMKIDFRVAYRLFYKIVL